MITESSWDRVPKRKHPGGRPTFNPYGDSVASLVRKPRDLRGDPRVFSNVVPADEVQRHVRWLYKMGDRENVTVQKSTDDNGDGTVTLLYWVRPRITRQRKK